MDKPSLWSKVDHRAVFVRLVQPATNQFTVESFRKVAAGGLLKSPTNRWAYISWNSETFGGIMSTRVRFYYSSD